MKDVTAAVIKKENRILITQRANEDRLSLLWEFPGGKIEKGESPEECLKREILEELNLVIDVGDPFTDSIYDYGSGKINLMAYVCSLVSGDLRLNVHADSLWVTVPELLHHKFAPADVPIVIKLVKDFIRQIVRGLEAMTVYRSLLDDCVVSQYYWLLKVAEAGSVAISDFLNLYSQLCHDLMDIKEAGASESFSMADYLADRILYLENPLSRRAGDAGLQGLPAYLTNAARKDLNALYQAATLPAAVIKGLMTLSIERADDAIACLNDLPEWSTSLSKGSPVLRDSQRSAMYSGSWGESLQELIRYHQAHGSGLFARYKGFIWERGEQGGRIKGISTPDPVRLEDFIGYEQQRELLIENTLQLLNGQRANNVLLYGGRGTGKSSSVKALLNAFEDKGLRIVEVPKNSLTDFPQIIRSLKDRPQKFILFIDDLAFEDSEEHYTALKAVLEGGLEVRPDNMVIYATSNRRHLVKERFSEREGMLSDGDEVHAADSMQEKLSLADRFGLTITFPSPVQEEYLKIVEGLAQQEGLDLPREELRREAIRWEMRYNGRSPRTARQFLTWLEGKHKLTE
ncbi:MAG: DUF815 domain-containing protein [Clostridia bacterium]|nr:DUF815 domain-containing protein [Clostridia bacterium]